MTKFSLHQRLNEVFLLSAERWRPAFSLYLPPLLALSLFNMANWAFLAFLPVYFDHLGLPQAKVAGLLSLFPLVEITLAIPFGVAGDSALSSKRLSLLGLVIFSLSVLLLRSIEAIWLFVPVLLLVAASGGLFSINCSAIYYKSLGEEGHGWKIGFLSAAIGISVGLGPLLAGGILKSAGMHALFLLAFFIVLPAFFLMALTKDIKPTKPSIHDYARDLGRREVLAFILATFSHAIHAGVEAVCLALFMKRHVGLGPDFMGGVFFLNCAFFSAGALLLGPLSGSDRRLKPLWLFVLGLLASGGFNFLMPFALSFSSLAVVRLFHVTGDASAALARGLLVACLFPAERRGGGLGLVGLVFPCGSLLGAALSGLFANYASPFFMAGALEVAGAIALVALRPDFPRPSGRPIPSLHHHSH